MFYHDDSRTTTYYDESGAVIGAGLPREEADLCYEDYLQAIATREYVAPIPMSR